MWFSTDNEKIRSHMETVIKFLSRNRSWSIFFLTCVPNLRETDTVRESDGIYSVRGLTTSAYVLNRRSIRMMKDLKFRNIPYDHETEKLKGYAVYPSIFIQNNFSTDIHNSLDLQGKYPTIAKIIFYFTEKYAYFIGFRRAIFFSVVSLGIAIFRFFPRETSIFYWLFILYLILIKYYS